MARRERVGARENGGWRGVEERERMGGGGEWRKKGSGGVRENGRWRGMEERQNKGWRGIE